MNSKSKCPYCGFDFDDHTCLPVGEDGEVDYSQADQKPSEGDVTICINCASILKFGKNMELNKIPLQDFTKLDFETAKVLLETQKEIRNMKSNQ